MSNQSEKSLELHHIYALICLYLYLFTEYSIFIIGYGIYIHILSLFILIMTFFSFYAIKKSTKTNTNFIESTHSKKLQPIYFTIYLLLQLASIIILWLCDKHYLSIITSIVLVCWFVIINNMIKIKKALTK